LNVDRGDDLDSRLYQLFRIFPPGSISAAWRIVIRQTVNEANVRVACEQCVEIDRCTSANVLERITVNLERSRSTSGDTWG
jgi:hypothetical protein